MTDDPSYKNDNLMKTGYIPLLIGVVAVVAAFVESSRTPCDQNIKGNPGARTVYAEENGNTQTRWLAGDRSAFECIFSEKEYGYRCGLDINFGSGTHNGINLRGFSSLFLKLKYSGPSSYFRISFRDAYQNPQIAPEGKQHQVVLVLENGVNKLNIPLGDFEVPGWWSDRNPHLEGQQLKPSWGNVTHIGLDIQTPMPPGTHTFEILEFCAVKPQGSNPTLIALLALASVSFLLAIFLFFRGYQLSKERTPSSADIKNLLRRFDELHPTDDPVQDSSAYDPVTNLYNRESSIEAMNDYTLEKPVAGMFLAIIETVGRQKAGDHAEETISPQARTAISIAVKMHIGSNQVAISWRKNRILILFPAANAARIKKVIKKIQANIVHSQLSGMPQNIDVQWQFTRIRQTETFKQACDRLEEELSKKPQ